MALCEEVADFRTYHSSSDSGATACRRILDWLVTRQLAGSAIVLMRLPRRVTLLREAEKAPPVRAGMNEGILRSLGEGGYASEGYARRSAVEGATAVKPWGSTKPKPVSAQDQLEKEHKRSGS